MRKPGSEKTAKELEMEIDFLNQKKKKSPMENPQQASYLIVQFRTISHTVGNKDSMFAHAFLLKKST